MDLELGDGQFVSIFGPNGAGKSTFLRILALLLQPTTGIIRYNGRPVNGEDLAFRGRIGMVSHQGFLYDGLTARENLAFYGGMYDVRDLGRRVPEVLDQVGLDLFANDPVRTFSRGMLQRLAIGRAILHRPEILLLDEPYTGLDQQARGILTEVLADHKRAGRSAVIISHDFEEGLALSDRAIILSGGLVTFSGDAADLTPAALKNIYLHCVGGVEE